MKSPAKSPALRWVLLALAGLAIAVAVGVIASRVTSQRIGLASEPLSAGESLAPHPENHGQRHGGSSSGNGGGDAGSETTTQQTTTQQITSSTTGVVPPPVSTTTDDSSSGTGDDSSGGDD